MQIPKHIIVAASAWGSRLVSIFVQFYSIRILLDLLGTDRYAVFTVTGSLVGWFLLADFGLGNSLQNQISHRRVNNQEYQDIILCAGIAIIPIFILLTLVVIVSSSFLSEFLFGNFYFLDNSQKKEIFRVASLIFLATAIGNISFKIWFSEHKGWISNIIPAVSSIFGLVLIANLTAKNLEVSNDIIFSIYCFYIPGAVIGIISFLFKIIPSIKYYNLLKKGIFYRLLKNGGGFFIFSLLSALVLQVDYIIMSKTLVGKDVVTYNIMSKIFGLINFIYAALLQSLWPICAEASSRGQFSDFQKIEKRYISFGFFIVLICAIFIFLLKDIILNIIAENKGLDFPLILIILFSLYHIVRVWTDTYSMFLLSIGKLKPLWISVPFQAMFSIFFQWYGAVNYGLVGLLCGLILSFLVTVSWWLPFSFRYIVNRLTKEKSLDV
ncbi:MATE family efflux transporter [Yersinia enterocolitica]|uniref:MATE family efflux transporter n=1 Tax=Yersinia enterocolitica TaxID=630 RepID=UPI0005E46BEF|nr:MATE family efflux transporter [Yersinia enterocolitica]CNF87015.1 LPS side chain defect: putative O-antigen transferase [Yersinia enterocolitica]CRY23042.1 LPS side chain defect: putative O-antigen transferase [Yersinia enterocolitica]